MGFKNIQNYQERVAKRRFKSPLKVAHIWIPLAFLMFTIYRNQALTQLSLAEAAVGLGISAISFLPLFVWASKLEREVPAFQCFCAVHFPFYAYPIVHCKPEYMAHPEPARLMAGVGVLVFLAVAELVYYWGITRLKTRGPTKGLAYRELPEKTAKSLFTLLLTGWALFLVTRHFGYLKVLGSFSNTVTSLACGGGIVSLWILSKQIAEGKLSTGHTFYVMAVIAIAMCVTFATGTLIFGFIMLIVGVVGYSLACRKVPWVTILVSLFIMSFLNLGKGEIRRIYWTGGFTPELSVSKIIDIYERWIPISWNALWSGRDPRGQKVQQLLDRANLMHVQALVMQNTPSQMPYLWGETYKYIPINLVPRFVWKEKPHTHMATTVLGLHYNVANRGSLRTTTIAFGTLPEAWANFGWIGVLVFAMVVGFTMQAVARACAGASPYSLHSLLSVVWVAWSFQIELSVSAWFSSFAQAVAAILILCAVFTREAKTSYAPNPAYGTG
ncbi:MAG TPA: hypothetical protein VHV55_04575 [Pirellulales bacterium]|nr:hypothetical protein [Pirellulales bacterium]